jgi:hypothetical protein
MRLNKLLAAAAAISLTTAPVLAQAAAPADRASADIKGEQLHGGFIIPLLALAAVILGILALTSNDDEDLPHSP